VISNREANDLIKFTISRICSPVVQLFGYSLTARMREIINLVTSDKKFAISCYIIEIKLTKFAYE
jgi:hypothetical protein